jgi:predicted nucleic acid-binding protein
MKKIVRLTELDLTRIVKRVINEDIEERYKREARIELYRLGYTPLVLSFLSAKELANKLREENKRRFGSYDELERLADKLDRFDN